MGALTALFGKHLKTMLRWFSVALHLLVETGAARRDARVRFLKAQIEILHRKPGGNRVLPSTDDRARPLATGRALDHNVADAIGIVTPQTYCRWTTGRRPKRVGRPKSAQNLRDVVLLLARRNAGWGCPPARREVAIGTRLVSR